MATLAISTDIPTAINTIERLACWSGLLLSNLYSNEFYKSNEEQPLQPVAQVAIGRDANGQLRMFVTYSIRLEENFLSNASNQDPWLYGLEVKSVVIPTSFKS